MPNQNSPYAGFDPEKDPYLQRYRNRESVEYDPDANIMYDLARHTNITARNLAALTLGLGGDIQPITALRDAKRQLPNSEELARRFGGDVEHPSWIPASLVAPGPGEVKTAATMLKGIVSETLQHAPDLAMVLFHGTPHRFDKFALDKIGTGTGAQGKGYGFYFAEDKGVGEAYQNSFRAEGGRWNADFELSPLAESHANNFREDLDGAIKEIKRLRQEYPEHKSLGDMRPKYDEAIEQLRRLKREGKFSKESYLYEIELGDDIVEKMMDWDAPISEQPENVRDALRGFGYDKETYEGETAGSIYERIMTERSERNAGWVSSERTDKELSQALREAGIPGIRFYDGSSRGAQEGTRNIVVFDPDDITQVKRDGDVVYKTKTPLEKTIEIVDKY